MSDTVRDNVRGLGHNQPPGLVVPTVIEIKEYLTPETKALADRAAMLSSMVSRYVGAVTVIDNEEEQARAADVVAQVKAHAALIDGRRASEKRAWIDGGNAVQAHFKALQDGLASTAKIEGMQTAFAREKYRREQAAKAEAARLAQEEADRLMEEAAASLSSSAIDAAEDAATNAFHAQKEAEAKPAEHSRVVSDYGVTASLQEVLVIELIDITKVPKEHLIFNESSVRRLVLDAKKHKQTVTVTGVDIRWESKIRNYAR